MTNKAGSEKQRAQERREAIRREDRARTRELQSLYDTWVNKNPGAAAVFTDVTKEILSDAGLTFDSVNARVKSFHSFRQKALRREPNGEYSYADPWHEIHDLVGVRVTTYHSTEIPDIVEALDEELTVLRRIDKTAETRISGQLGYGSHHLICRVDENSPTELSPYEGLLFEVQVRTVLQHAWAEFEHDIRYKSSGQHSDPRIDRAFALAAGLIELADQQFDQVAQILEESRQPHRTGSVEPDVVATQESRREITDSIELTEEMLPGVLTLLLPKAPRSKSEHYPWLEELLSLNGINTFGQLRELVQQDKIAELEKAMRYKFTPGHVRIVDDLLLATFGQDHIDRTETTGDHQKRRKTRLRVRFNQLKKAGLNPLSLGHGDDPAGVDPSS